MTFSTDVMRLARGGMGALPLYAPDLAMCAVDLSDNTNLWGAPPAAVRALREAPVTALSRYPTLYSEPLRGALLAYAGIADVPEIGVMTGCGSDDVLDSTMRAFGASGDSIAFSAPTFSMIPVLARLNGLTPVPIPFVAGFDLDAERLVGLLVGDVSGKGVSAAFYMAEMKGIFQSLSKIYREPKEFLSHCAWGLLGVLG